MKFSIIALVMLISISAQAGITYVDSLSVTSTNFDSEIILTNGLTIGGVRRTTWPSGGSAPTGTLVGPGTAVATGALVKFNDTSGTNAAAASTADIQAALGQVYQATNANLTLWTAVAPSAKQDALGYTPVNKAGDSMTGTLLVTGLTNSANTASRVIGTTSTKAETTSFASAALLASLTDPTGTGVVPFNTSPTFQTSLTLTNSSTGTTPFVINHASGATVPAVTVNVGGVQKFNVSELGVISGASGGSAIRTSSGTVEAVTPNNGAYVSFKSSGLTLGDSTGANSITLNAEASNIAQQGADSATPAAQTFKGPDGLGSNITGADMNFGDGRGTGTGPGGNINFLTAAAGTTGSSQNAQAIRWSIGPTGTFSSSTNAIQTGAPAGTAAGLIKFGAVTNETVVVSTTSTLRIDIGGTVYKLIIAQ